MTTHAEELPAQSHGHHDHGHSGPKKSIWLRGSWVQGGLGHDPGSADRALRRDGRAQLAVRLPGPGFRRRGHLHDAVRGRRLPDRDRLLRLLVRLSGRQARLGRGGSLRPRRVQLEGLLQGQHRSQSDRGAVHLHDLHLLHHRRGAGRGRARRAGHSGRAVLLTGHLQRPVLGACRADDLPVHHPRLRRARQRRHPADAGRPGHGLPAPQRALVLDAAGGRRVHGARRSWSARSTPAGRTIRRWPCTAPPARRSG